MTRKIVWLVSILGLQIALVAVLLLLGVTRSGEFECPKHYSALTKSNWIKL